MHAAEGYARSTENRRSARDIWSRRYQCCNRIDRCLIQHSNSLLNRSGSTTIGTDAFQEADTTGITRACTKHTDLVKKSDDLSDVMHEAFHVAANGRPGPVVGLAKDILFADAPYFAPKMLGHVHINLKRMAI